MHYEYSSTEKEKFSLHDCRATSVEMTDKQLVFCFPDGFFYKDYTDDWPNTGKSAVAYSIDGEYRTDGGMTFYLFDDRDDCEIREKYTIEQVAGKINSGEWELEFGYQYEGYQEVFHTGWIWQNHEPWSRECQMFIGPKEAVVYRWDSPTAGKKRIQ